MLCLMRLSEIILVDRNGIELKRKVIERPLGYFMKQRKEAGRGRYRSSIDPISWTCYIEGEVICAS